MGIFVDLLERLQTDIETVHGRRLPVTWRYVPTLPKDQRWSVFVGEQRVPHPDGRHFSDSVVSHDGETPLRRLAEDYAARAHLIRERQRKGKR